MVINILPKILPWILILFRCPTSFYNRRENNNAAIENLYSQIDALCNAWFVDYSYFGGEQPDDWAMRSLSELATFVSGYSYKGTELVDSADVAMATIKNFDRKGGFKLNGYKPIEPSPKLKSSQHVELFDTLVAHTDLTQNAEVIGNAEVVLSKGGYEDIIFSMDVVKVLPKTDMISKFLIAALLHGGTFKRHCLGYVNGTTVLHLSKKALPEFEIALPSELNDLKPLDKAVTALYYQISNIMEENLGLQKLRDGLLPEFIAGNVCVDDVKV